MYSILILNEKCCMFVEQADEYTLVFPGQTVKVEGDVSKGIKSDELLAMK